MLGTSVRAAGEHSARDAVGLPAVFAAMHLSWGSASCVVRLAFGPPLAALARIVGLSRRPEKRVRLGVYTDYHYWREDDSYYAERAFFTFITSLRPLMDRIVLFGRVNPSRARSHYRVPDDIDFVPLPHYPSLAHPLAALRDGRLPAPLLALLDDVDAVWLLGPHLLAIGFARARSAAREEGLPRRAPGPAALCREPPPGQALDDVGRKRSRGDVQADGPPLPGRGLGPQLAANYGGAGGLLAVSVSLVGEDQIVDPAEAAAKPWDNGERGS